MRREGPGVKSKGSVGDVRDAVVAADGVLRDETSPLSAVAASVHALRGALARASPLGSLASVAPLLDGVVLPRLARLVGAYLDGCLGGGGGDEGCSGGGAGGGGGGGGGSPLLCKRCAQPGPARAYCAAAPAPPNASARSASVAA